MLKVFISYSRQDGKEPAERLEKELENAKFEVWRDLNDIPGGTEWRKELRKALREIDVVAVLLTTAAVESEWVRLEYEVALTLGKRVIPLMISPSELPAALAHLQYHDLSQEKLYHENLLKLIRELERATRHVLLGAILYVNILKFSMLQPDEQEDTVNFCKGEVEKFLKTIQHEPNTNYLLDFHGGDFLLFIERQPNQTTVDTLLTAFLFGLHLKLEVRGKSFDLGVTLHWADDVKTIFLDTESYAMGDGLYRVQLLMSFSDSGHFFISENAQSLTQRLTHLRTATLGGLLQDMLPKLPDMPNGLKEELKHWLTLPKMDYAFKCDEFTFHDRHKRRHRITNFYIEDSQGGAFVGSPAIPRHRVAIEFRDEPNAPHQIFIQRLVEADEVIILGLTHERTAMFLQRALNERQEKGLGFWQSFQIIFPSEAILATILEKERTHQTRRQNWQDGKSIVFRFLLTRGTEHLDKWQCLEYNGHLPFIANQFINKQGASVRIAPILPGGDTRETYYMEIFKGMPAYQQLADAFSVICNKSARIVEWDVYGELDNERLRYGGIVNRTRLDEVKGKYRFPVILVILYADVGVEGHASLLQERTIFNAGDAHGTFSNISGRIIELDVLNTKGISPTTDYIEHNYGQDHEDFAATLAFNTLAQFKGAEYLDHDIWEAAAIREIKEELGLEIEPSRLVYHRQYAPDNQNILFRIFSLKLRRDTKIDELKIVNKLRPQANLQPFDMETLKQAHKDNKFNRLLQNRFNEVFVPIFQELEIK